MLHFLNLNSGLTALTFVADSIERQNNVCKATAQDTMKNAAEISIREQVFL